MQKYEEKKFNLPNLKGLSDKQISEHLKLYAGYVKNTNDLRDRMDTIMRSSAPDAYTLGELRRRMGFEFNGMRLHEYYFDSLGGDGKMSDESNLKNLVIDQYGSTDNWLAEIKNTATMRGIGWAIVYYDPTIKALHTAWISDHELGHLASLPIILTIDVWEHAYLLDYLPSQRKDYIEAFFANLNWKIVEERLKI